MAVGGHSQRLKLPRVPATLDPPVREYLTLLVRELERQLGSANSQRFVRELVEDCQGDIDRQLIVRDELTNRGNQVD